MMQLRPMLASHAPEDLDQLRYPLLASPKLDGIRCLIVNGQAVSRTLKPIRNQHIQALLGRSDLDGLDGELIVGDPTAPDCYRRTDSAVMSADGEPDFVYHVFDKWDIPIIPFEQRNGLIEKFSNLETIVCLPQLWIENAQLLESHEAGFLAEGYEGLILRDPNAPYKFGRSTKKQQAMLKLKRFVDGEAIVVGVEELQRNYNEATLDERGYTKRSSHQENKCGAGVLGALVCTQYLDNPLTIMAASKLQPQELPRFSIGTGFDAATRALLWSQRDSLLGRIVKYKSFPVGVKDKPRHPVFLGFRDRSDM